MGCHCHTPIPSTLVISLPHHLIFFVITCIIPWQPHSHLGSISRLSFQPEHNHTVHTSSRTDEEDAALSLVSRV